MSDQFCRHSVVWFEDGIGVCADCGRTRPSPTDLWTENADLRAQLAAAVAREAVWVGRLERIHNACADPSRPRQSVGEMIAALLTDIQVKNDDET